MVRTITRRGRRQEIQQEERASRVRTVATRAVAAGGAAGLALLVVRALRGRGREAHGQDVVDLLLARHREVRQHIEEYERSSAEPRLREHLLDDLRSKLSSHEAVEEQLIHPLVRRNLPDGHRIAAEVLSQEQQAQELLAEIEHTEPHTPRMDELTAELFAKVRLHQQTEETEVFPALRLYLGPRERMRLGTMVERVERLSPTHPHPHAPKTPPGNIIVSAPAAFLDRARDRAARNRDRV
jgi:hemerythrin superfamily protein